jgi:hypothetical protein
MWIANQVANILIKVANIPLGGMSQDLMEATLCIFYETCEINKHFLYGMK